MLGRVVQKREREIRSRFTKTSKIVVCIGEREDTDCKPMELEESKLAFGSERKRRFGGWVEIK